MIRSMPNISCHKFSQYRNSMPRVRGLKIPSMLVLDTIIDTVRARTLTKINDVRKITILRKTFLF
jgi:hypothetical protein